MKKKSDEDYIILKINKGLGWSKDDVKLHTMLMFFMAVGCIIQHFMNFSFFGLVLFLVFVLVLNLVINRRGREV